MGKVGFLFSGQGAQYSGMGKELHNTFDICKDVFDIADNALGFKISDICFDENYIDKLNNTEFCQPAILVLSIACFKLLTNKGIRPDFLAGLSLGEYSALTASNVIKFEDAVNIVNKRGKFMSQAVPKNTGLMSAILGIEAKDLEKICSNVSKDKGYVICANYNAPKHTVISGESSSVKKVEDIALKNGAKRAIRINVAGPFHTPLIISAKHNLENELNKISIEDFDIPIVSNVDGKIIKNKDDIKNILLQQIISPVYWERSIRTMINNGVNTFIELGCGKTLISFVKRIDRNVKIYNIEDLKSYNNTINNLT